MSDREQVGWVRFDGDEYHDFRYSSPDDKRRPASTFADLLPVYVDVAEQCEWRFGGSGGLRCTEVTGHGGNHRIQGDFTLVADA